jgi:hypothetical protein
MMGGRGMQGNPGMMGQGGMGGRGMGVPGQMTPWCPFAPDADDE